jgi:hypothetical protein
VPDVFLYLCLEVTPDDFALIYSMAQRKGKDVKSYIRDVLREDITRSLQPVLSETPKKGGKEEGGEK